MVDLIGAGLGFLFTLLVFSYVLGDNPLFRFTISVFVGVSAGFAGAVALRNVIFPDLLLPLLRVVLLAMTGTTPPPEDMLVLLPLFLSALLLMKMSRSLGRMGNVAMAYLVGVGAAAAIGGAVLGTLFPQLNASMNLMDLGAIDIEQADFLTFGWEAFSRLVALVGTLATLIYFHFGARAEPNAPPQRSPWIEFIGKLGQGFIAITFGMMFAGVYAAAVTALIERLFSLQDFLLRMLEIGI